MYSQKKSRHFRCWMDECRCAGWMMDEGLAHFLIVFALDETTHLLQQWHCTRGEIG